MGHEGDALDPLDAAAAVPARHHEPQRRPMVRAERPAVQGRRQEGVPQLLRSEDPGRTGARPVVARAVPVETLHQDEMPRWHRRQQLAKRQAIEVGDADQPEAPVAAVAGALHQVAAHGPRARSDSRGVDLAVRQLQAPGVGRRRPFGEARADEELALGRHGVAHQEAAVVEGIAAGQPLAFEPPHGPVVLADERQGPGRRRRRPRPNGRGQSGGEESATLQHWPSLRRR